MKNGWGSKCHLSLTLQNIVGDKVPLSLTLQNMEGGGMSPCPAPKCHGYHISINPYKRCGKSLCFLFLMERVQINTLKQRQIFHVVIANDKAMGQLFWCQWPMTSLTGDTP